MTKQKLDVTYDHVYEIVRVDTFQEWRVDAPDIAIIVKKVVWDAETAEAEAKRLNVLNAGKAVYFVALTRLRRRSAAGA